MCRDLINRLTLIPSQSNIFNTIMTSARSSAENISQSGVSAETRKMLLDSFELKSMKSTAVMIHARISNLPLGLVAPIHKNLLEDLQWSRSHGEGLESEESNHFKSISNLLLITTCSNPPSGSGEVQDITHRSSILLDNFDDDIFLQESVAAMLYKPSHSRVHLVAMLLPTASITSCIQQISNLS